MRHLLATISLAAFASAAATAAGPQLTPAQREATHAMFEHIIDTPITRAPAAWKSPAKAVKSCASRVQPDVSSLG